MAIGAIIGIAYGVILTRDGASSAEMAAAVAAISARSTVSMFGVFLGLFVTVLCGYVCARISRRRDYSLAYILISLDLVATFLSWADYSAYEHALLASLSAVTILAGTRMGMPQPVT